MGAVRPPCCCPALPLLLQSPEQRGYSNCKPVSRVLGGVETTLAQLLVSSTEEAVQEEAHKYRAGSTALVPCRSAGVCDAGGVTALVQLTDASAKTRVQEVAAWPAVDHPFTWPLALGTVAHHDAACKAAVCVAGGVETLCVACWSTAVHGYGWKRSAASTGHCLQRLSAGRNRLCGAAGCEAVLRQLLRVTITV